MGWLELNFLLKQEVRGKPVKAGQTFWLSLYVPSIDQLLGISNTEFGSVYAIATGGCAFTLPWINPHDLYMALLLRSLHGGFIG